MNKIVCNFVFVKVVFPKVHFNFQKLGIIGKLCRFAGHCSRCAKMSQSPIKLSALDTNAWSYKSWKTHPFVVLGHLCICQSLICKVCEHFLGMIVGQFCCCVTLNWRTQVENPQLIFMFVMRQNTIQLPPRMSTWFRFLLRCNLTYPLCKNITVTNKLYKYILWEYVTLNKRYIPCRVY